MYRKPLLANEFQRYFIFSSSTRFTQFFFALNSKMSLNCTVQQKSIYNNLLNVDNIRGNLTTVGEMSVKCRPTFTPLIQYGCHV